VSSKEIAASNDERAGSEPHWLRSTSFSVLAIRERREAITLSRILETVCSRTMTLNEAGES